MTRLHMGHNGKKATQENRPSIPDPEGSRKGAKGAKGVGEGENKQTS